MRVAWGVGEACGVREGVGGEGGRGMRSKVCEVGSLFSVFFSAI